MGGKVFLLCRCRFCGCIEVRWAGTVVEASSERPPFRAGCAPSDPPISQDVREKFGELHVGGRDGCGNRSRCCFTPREREQEQPLVGRQPPRQTCAGDPNRAQFANRISVRVIGAPGFGHERGECQRGR
jgi:hypothetical protein